MSSPVETFEYFQHAVIEQVQCISNTGEDAALLLANVCLGLPNVDIDERAPTRFNGSEIPGMIGPIEGLVGETPSERITALFSHWLQMSSAIAKHDPLFTFVLCPESTHEVLRAMVGGLAGDWQFMASPRDAFTALNKALAEVTHEPQQRPTLRLVCVDSLIDYPSFAQATQTLAHEANPYGLIPGEGLSCVYFAVQANCASPLYMAYEPNAEQAQQTLTQAGLALLSAHSELPQRLWHNGSDHPNTVMELHRLRAAPETDGSSNTAKDLEPVTIRASLGFSGLNEVLLPLVLAGIEQQLSAQPRSSSLFLFLNDLRVYWPTPMFSLPNQGMSNE